MQGSASADLAVADLAMHDMTVMESNQDALAQTVTLTILEAAPLTRSIADFRSMPFMEFATLHAVSIGYTVIDCQLCMYVLLFICSLSSKLQALLLLLLAQVLFACIMHEHSHGERSCTHA